MCIREEGAGVEINITPHQNTGFRINMTKHNTIIEHLLFSVSYSNLTIMVLQTDA